MTISGVGDKWLSKALLFDLGTITWQDGGNIIFQNASEIDERGTFTANTSASMKDGGGDNNTFSLGAAVQDVGHFTANPGAGKTLDLSVLFVTKSGSSTTVTSGTLRTDRGSDLNGTINIASGADLSLFSLDNFSKSPDKLDGVTTKGLGTLEFAAHVSVVAASTVSNQTITDWDTTLDGPADLTMANDPDFPLGFSTTYNWTAGTWTGSGKMIVKAVVNFVSTPFAAFPVGRTIDIYGGGEVHWQGNDDISVSGGANIIVENGGYFDIEVDKNILNGGAGSFQNKGGGVVQKWPTTGITRIDLPFFPFNGGKIEAKSGSIMFSPFLLNGGGAIIISGPNAKMAFNAGFEQDSGTTSLTSGNAAMTVTGNLVMTGGTFSTVTSGTDTVSVSAQVQQSGGTVTVGAGCSITASDEYLESGGTIELTGGTVGATNAVQVSGGGVLEGFGFVNGGSGGLTNSGTINPGDESGSAYNIYVTGNYTQTGSGVLNVAISGGSSATDDPLKVSGTATLGGTLDVILIGTAQAGTTLDVLYYAIRNGGFANVYVPSGWTWYYDDTQSPDGVYAKLTYNGPPH